MRVFVLSLAAVLTAGAAAAQVADRDVAWAKTPTNDEVIAAWPYEAARRGKTGKAVIRCDVSPEGGLQGCAVVSETPAGLGFGAAALTLAPQFRFTPKIEGGKPVRSTAQIPISWTGSPGRAGGRISMLNKPIWSLTPVRADVDAVHPARAAGVQGSATLDCVVRPEGTLRNCSVVTEAPERSGFGEAAKALAPKFKLAVVTLATGQSVGGARVRIPFQFDPPGGDGGDLGGANIAAPNWRMLPDASKLAALYPEKAIAAGITEGRGVVNCVVQPGGALGGCAVVGETPADMGFGAAALAMTSSFALSPWTEDGKPTDGARVRIPIKYVLPEEDETSAAAASSD